MAACLRKAASAALVLLIAAGTGEAAMTQAALDDLAVEPRPGAALPLGLPFVDEDGRTRTLGDILNGTPAVVVFTDYTCRTLCGPILTFVSAGLEHSGLAAGVDYRLVVIGLDPRDDLKAARDMKAAHIGSAGPLAAAAIMLRGEDATIKAAAAAVGYRYAYDAGQDQFAHPAAAFVVNPAGRVSRVLSPLGLDGPDLRLALVEAGEGRVGSLGDRLRLLCYGFDPARGIYTETITLWLQAAAIATVLSLAAAMAAMSARMRRRSPRPGPPPQAGKGEAREPATP